MLVASSDSRGRRDCWEETWERRPIKRRLRNVGEAGRVVVEDNKEIKERGERDILLLVIGVEMISFFGFSLEIVSLQLMFCLSS